MSTVQVDAIAESTTNAGVIVNNAFTTKTQSLSSSSGVLAINLASGNTGSITLTENITDIDFTNVPSTGFVEFQLIITQHASSAKTVGFDKITVNSGSEAKGLSAEARALAVSTSVDSLDIFIFKFNNASNPMISIEKKYIDSSFPSFGNELFRLDAGDVNSYNGSGTQWTDISGNSNNFTLSGFSAWDSNGHFTLDANSHFYKTSLANNVGTLYMVLQTPDTQAIMFTDRNNSSSVAYVGAFRVANQLYHAGAGSPTTYVNDSTSTSLYTDLIDSTNVRLVTITGLSLSGWNNNDIYGGSAYGSYTFDNGGKVLAAGGFTDTLTSAEVVELHTYFKDTKGYVS
jgi:hypothetical protein